MQADSLVVIADTISEVPEYDSVIAPEEKVSDTVVHNTEKEQISNVVEESVPEPVFEDKTDGLIVKPIPVKTAVTLAEPADTLKDSSNIVVVPKEVRPFVLYPTFKNDDSSKFKQSAQIIPGFQSETTTTSFAAQPRNKVRVFEKEWVLGISIFVVVLLIIVRVFYQKHLTSIIASVVNIQLADKLLWEKNVLSRRVFLLLNVTYVITLALYFYQLVKRMDIQFSIDNEFFLFLFILAVSIAIIVGRLIIVRTIAFIFDAVPAFSEYLHNSFIINKNLGLYLFPVVASIIYVTPALSNYLFILATIMLAISVLFRYLKGIQIILKHNIFLFYSILYLCTLEILPVLIGIKFVLER